jgi:hypothetical protein
MAGNPEEIAFTALLQRLGISTAISQLINDAGFTTTSDLIGVDNKDIENLLKIIRTCATPLTLVPYVSQKRLNTLCYWVNLLDIIYRKTYRQQNSHLQHSTHL